MAGPGKWHSPVDTVPQTGCYSLKQLSVYRTTNNGCALGHKLPSETDPEGLQRLDEVPHAEGYP